MKYGSSLKNLSWYQTLLLIPELAFAFVLSSRIIVFCGIGSSFLKSGLLGALVILGAVVFSKKLTLCKETKEKLQKILLCLACTLGFYFFLPAKTIIWIPVFFLIYAFLPHCPDTAADVRCERCSLLIAVILAGFVFVGYQLTYFGRLEILYDEFNGDRFSTVFFWLFRYACLICLFAVFLRWAFGNLENTSFSDDGQMPLKSKAKSCIIIAVIIFACWLPVFIALYPGVLSPDSISELHQQLGLEALSNHHPIIHQLFIKAGLVLGVSITAGVGIYSIIQMAIMAFCFSYAVVFVKSRCTKKAVWIALLLFYALFPINSVYSVTAWKDVLFAGFSTLLAVLLIQENCCGSKSVTRLLALIVVSFLFCTMRNNGKYAFCLGFPFLIPVNRGNWKRLTAVFASVLLLVLGYQYVLFDVMKISDSRSSEALSVPLQQIARAVSVNRPDLEDDRFEPLREIFPEIESLREKYNPKISDPIKAEGVFDSERFDAAPTRYLKSWLELGLEYPITYVEGFLLQNMGYWYPDITDYDTHTLCYGANDPVTGISDRPGTAKLRLAIALLNLSLEYEQPTGIFFSPALPIWVLIFSLSLLVLKRQYSLASPIILICMIWLTTLASPVYNEFRYVYAVFTAAPIFLGLSISEKTKESI